MDANISISAIDGMHFSSLRVPSILAKVKDIGTAYPGSFMIGKHVNWRFREKLNRQILRFLAEETFFKYWYRRYDINQWTVRTLHQMGGSVTKITVPEPVAIERARSFKLSEIRIGLIFWVAGIFVGFVSFTIEVCLPCYCACQIWCATDESR